MDALYFAETVEFSAFTDAARDHEGHRHSARSRAGNGAQTREVNARRNSEMVADCDLETYSATRHELLRDLRAAAPSDSCMQVLLGSTARTQRYPETLLPN